MGRRERGDLNHEIHETHEKTRNYDIGIIQNHECTRMGTNGEKGERGFKPRNTRNTRKNTKLRYRDNSEPRMHTNGHEWGEGREGMGPCLFIYKNVNIMKRHTKSASISFRRDSLRGLFALLRLAYAMACPDVEEARQQAGGPLEVWWSLGDSNPWPIRCERIALAN